MREWLVIESSMSRGVFVSDTPEAKAKGYIPRDVVEKLLPGKLEEDGRCTWFTHEDGEKMRAHPEWRDTEPPGPDPRVRAAKTLYELWYAPLTWEANATEETRAHCLKAVIAVLHAASSPPPAEEKER